MTECTRARTCEERSAGEQLHGIHPGRMAHHCRRRCMHRHASQVGIARVAPVGRRPSSDLDEHRDGTVVHE